MSENDLVFGLFAGVWFFAVIAFGLWMIALIDILKADFRDSSNKIIWLLLTLFLPVLGPLLYFLVGTGQRKKGTGINLKAAITVLTFFIWYPLAVLLMWIWTDWSKVVKIIITVIGISIILLPFLAR